MADAKTLGLGCSFVVGEMPDGSAFAGHPRYCGRQDGTRKDPRQERYDIGLCPRHWAIEIEDPR